jgi:hypothetical protein
VVRSAAGAAVIASRFHSDEQLVPFVMLARGRGAPTREGLIQQTEVSDQSRLHPAPIGKRAAAGTANLIAQELDGAIMNSIVMWFDNPIFVSVEKPNQTSVLDGYPEQFIDL